jgi:hypothetical protein
MPKIPMAVWLPRQKALLPVTRTILSMCCNE